MRRSVFTAFVRWCVRFLPRTVLIKDSTVKAIFLQLIPLSESTSDYYRMGISLEKASTPQEFNPAGYSR